MDRTYITHIVRIKRSVTNKRRAIMLISQFRFENPEFLYDYDLNIAKLFINNNNIDQAINQLEKIRKLLFEKFSGSMLLINRYSKTGDTGLFDQIPTEIMNHIMDRPI